MKQSNDFCFDLFCVRTALKKATTDLSLLALASPCVTCSNNPKTISLLLLHASATLTYLRASRSLLRQVFLEGLGGVFLRVFFVSGFGEDFS